MPSVKNKKKLYSELWPPGREGFDSRAGGMYNATIGDLGSPQPALHSTIFRCKATVLFWTSNAILGYHNLQRAAAPPPAPFHLCGLVPGVRLGGAGFRNPLRNKSESYCSQV